jgi:hypothetical protein
MRSSVNAKHDLNPILRKPHEAARQAKRNDNGQRNTTQPAPINLMPNPQNRALRHALRLVVH